MNYELEKEIDETGREKVFQRARELGWGLETPPEWVWRGIINEVKASSVKDDR